MGRRNHYHVYVIELSKDVLSEGRFKKSNPDYVTGKLNRPGFIRHFGAARNTAVRTLPVIAPY
jgi:hypothetical protein